MASLYITRGDLAVAMMLYLQSLEIFDGLGDLQGKSTALYQIAEIHTIRGDLLNFDEIMSAVFAKILS
jgi:hypothetical protein